jgi:diguanylate cyclase (GGDEF)-like protein
MAFLDVRTVFFICTSFLLIYSIGAVAFARKVTSSFDGIYLFAIASFLTAIGITLVFLRGYIDIFWSVIVGNSLIMLSGNVTYHAHLKFIRYKKNPVLRSAILLISAISLFVVFTYIVPDTSIRVTILNEFNCLQFLLIATTIYHFQKQTQQTIYTPLMIIAGAFTLLLAVWIIFILMGEPFPPYKLQGGWMHSMMIIVLMLYVATLDFCVVLIATEQLIQKVTIKSHQDILTTLYNRRGLDHALQKNDILNRPLAVIMGDIDNFKLINDQYGHPVGDIIIKKFAEIIKASTRNTDICVRWGGEEFLIMLPMLNTQEAFVVADKIRRVCEQQTFPEQHRLRFTSSFGICSGDNYSFDELVGYADQALYQAKTQGRNRVCVFISEV